MARRLGNGAKAAKSDAQTVVEEDESADEVTRCICGNDEFVSTPRTKALNASPGLYVQCERCNVWQHGFCMGFLKEEDVPNDYYCELCEPTFHRISQRHGVLMSKYRPVQPPPNASPRRGDVIKTESSKDRATKVPGGTKPSTTQAASRSKGLHKATDLHPDTESGSNARQQLVKEPNTNPKPHQSNGHALREPVKPELEDQLANNDGQMGEASADLKADESKKRSRRPTSDAETSGASAPRNRKRRSREDEILQRVLEESAREAREAEARRRSEEGLPVEPQPEARAAANESEHEEQGEENASDRQGRTRRTRNTSTTSAENGRGNDPARNGTVGGVSSPRASRVGRPTRGGRRAGGQRGLSNSDEPTAPASPSSSRRTANGVKKCKPRIPSQKTTLDEMRRRVASMLEYSSLIQDELAEERNNGIDLLRQSAGTKKFDSSLKHLTKLCDQNFASFEDLTRKLLVWEEQYGISESP